jgi:threonine dehydratase
MVLAAVEDLLFSSKIRAVAKQVGADVVFARTSADVLTHARGSKPVLVIFDLNGSGTDPIATLKQLKSDPETARIRAIGFVSHVQADVIHAARAAGADEVMARSAFVTQLPEILGRATVNSPQSPQRAQNDLGSSQMSSAVPALSAVNSVSRADVEMAARRIAGRVACTPLRRSQWLSEAADADVWLKLECVQTTGSFKLRGAFNAALAHLERHGGSAPPLVTASAGNHGRALALAAEQLRLALTVFVPADVPRAKTRAIEAHGATLVLERDYDAAEAAARAHARRTGATFISPYNDRDVIAGAGTVALEAIAALSEIGSFVVPVGGGGLASGIGVVLKTAPAPIRMIGVETDASHAFHASLAAGRITHIDPKPTLADGLSGNLEAGSITFQLMQQVCDGIALVSEDDLRGAIAGLVREEHVIAEGAGAASVAAILSGRAQVARDSRVVAIVSGSNIDAETLKEMF